jgi:hypothetical protein
MSDHFIPGRYFACITDPSPQGSVVKCPPKSAGVVRCRTRTEGWDIPCMLSFDPIQHHVPGGEGGASQHPHSMSLDVLARFVQL